MCLIPGDLTDRPGGAQEGQAVGHSSPWLLQRSPLSPSPSFRSVVDFVVLISALSLEAPPPVYRVRAERPSARLLSAHLCHAFRHL